MREDILAKRMFLAGCFFLPWLWAVNVLYFRRKVYGRIPCWDSLTDNEDDEGREGSQGLLPNITGDEDEYEDEHSVEITAAEIEAETLKWVNRSSYSALSAFALFVAWIVTFQSTKGSWGPNWFVMSEDEAERTGW